MDFEFLNVELVETLSFNFQKLENTLNRLFSDEKGIINIVFVSLEDIQGMNRNYRDKDVSTDVLAFNYSGGIDSDFIIGGHTVSNTENQDLVNSENVIGEILISPEYLRSDRRFNREEVIRMIVHGILHILGYEHNGYFSEENEQKEKMFIKQEKLVNKIIKKI